MDKPPELVVFRTVRDVSQCSECQKEMPRGGFLYMEKGEPFCLKCAKLDQLEYLPRGDAKLTRRVAKESGRLAVVVEFSRTRKKYERQGLLAEKEIINKVLDELS